MHSSGKVPTRLLVGICAYNEEHNIGKLLRNLLINQKLPANSEILVLCSGCTDGTPRIVREFSNEDERIQPVVENTRKGKANALNKIFGKAKKSADVLVLVNADARPAHGSIQRLISQLTERRGAVFARPVPLDGMQGISNRIAHVIWNLHHYVSSCRKPKLSAELCAIKSGCLENIPENIATDEPYIELSIRRQGFQVSYVPEALVYIRCPTRILDLLKQRIRIRVGHLQISKRTGFRVPTADLKILLWTISTLKLRDIPYALLGALLEGLAYLVARLDFSVGRVPYAWEPIESTKTSI
jgi:cellulose synthase/poly-beta-1,6-N-acetylglucosamine synthase-like glycosyltransferase